MAAFRQLPRGWYAAAGLTLAVAGCTSTPKNPLTTKSNPQPATTAVSGSGEFASNAGPKDPAKIHLAYGQWQEQMGQQAEARESYRKVLEDQPKNIDALLGMARVDQAGGLMDDAGERLKKAQKIAPKDARVHASFGNYYAAKKEWDKAVECQQAAVKAAPTDPRYQFLLGVALARSGDTDGAYPYFVRSLGDAEAHYNLGLILNEQNDRAGALEHIEQALALKPELQQAQAMLERLQRGDQPVFANGSQRTGTGATPISGVRSVPLKSEQQHLPNNTPLPRTGGRFQSAPAQAASPQPPAGLTPAQQEQWRNQQGQ